MDPAFQMQRVVVHTDSQYSFIGTVTMITHDAVELTEVIAIDRHETRLSLEQVLLECIDEAHSPTRRRLRLARPRIVAYCLLADIIRPGDRAEE